MSVLFHGVLLVEFDHNRGNLIACQYPKEIKIPKSLPIDTIVDTAIPDGMHDHQNAHSYIVHSYKSSTDGDLIRVIYGVCSYVRISGSQFHRGSQQKALVVLTHHPLFSVIRNILARGVKGIAETCVSESKEAQATLGASGYISFPSWATAYSILKAVYKKSNTMEVCEELNASMTSYYCSCVLRGKTIKYSAAVYSRTSLPIAYDDMEVVTSPATGEDEYGGIFLWTLMEQLSDIVMLLWRHIIFQKRILILGHNPGTVGDVVLSAALLAKPLRGIRYHIIPNMCLTDSIPSPGIDGSALLIAGSTNDMQENIVKFDLVIRLTEDSLGHTVVEKPKELHNQLDEGELEFAKFLRAEMQSSTSESILREQFLLFTYYALLFINQRLTRSFFTKGHSRGDSKGYGASSDSGYSVTGYGSTNGGSVIVVGPGASKDLGPGITAGGDREGLLVATNSSFGTHQGLMGEGMSMIQNSSYDAALSPNTSSNWSQEMSKSEMRELKTQFQMLFGRDKTKFFPRQKFRLLSKFTALMRGTELLASPMFVLFQELNKKLRDGAVCASRDNEEPAGGTVHSADMIDSMMYFDGCSLNNSTNMILELIHHNKTLTSFVAIASERLQKVQQVVLGGLDYVDSVLEKRKARESSEASNSGRASPLYNPFGMSRGLERDPFGLFVESSPFRGFISKKRRQDEVALRLFESFIREHNMYAAATDPFPDALAVMGSCFGISPSNASSSSVPTAFRPSSMPVPSAPVVRSGSSSVSTPSSSLGTQDPVGEIRPLPGLLRQHRQGVETLIARPALKLDIQGGQMDEHAVSKARRNIMTPTSNPWRGDDGEKRSFAALQADFEAFLTTYMEMRMVGILCLTYNRDNTPPFPHPDSSSSQPSGSDAPTGEGRQQGLHRLKQAIKKLRQRLEKMVGKWYRGYNPNTPATQLQSPGDSKVTKITAGYESGDTTKSKGLKLKIGGRDDKGKSAKPAKREKVKTPSCGSFYVSSGVAIPGGDGAFGERPASKAEQEGRGSQGASRGNPTAASYSSAGSGSSTTASSQATSSGGGAGSSIQGGQQLPSTISAHSSLLSLFNILFIFVSHNNRRVRSLALQCVELLTRPSSNSTGLGFQPTGLVTPKFGSGSLRGSYINIVNAHNKDRAFRREVSKLAHSSAIGSAKEARETERQGQRNTFLEPDNFASESDDRLPLFQSFVPNIPSSLTKVQGSARRASQGVQNSQQQSPHPVQRRRRNSETPCASGNRANGPTNRLSAPCEAEAKPHSPSHTGALQPNHSHTHSRSQHPECPSPQKPLLLSPAPSALYPPKLTQPASLVPLASTQPKSPLMSLILKEILLRNYDDLLLFLIQSSDTETRNIALQILINVVEQREIAEGVAAKETFWNTILGLLFFRDLEAAAPLALALLKSVLLQLRPDVSVSPLVLKVLVRHLFQVPPDDVKTVPVVLTLLGVDVVGLLSGIREDKGDKEGLVEELCVGRTVPLLPWADSAPLSSASSPSSSPSPSSSYSCPSCPSSPFASFSVTPESLYERALGLFSTGKSMMPHVPRYAGSPLSLLRSSYTAPMVSLRRRMTDKAKYAKHVFNYVTSLDTFTLFLPLQDILSVALSLKPLRATALLLHLLGCVVRAPTLVATLAGQDNRSLWSHLGDLGFRVFEAMVRWVVEARGRAAQLEQTFLHFLGWYVADRGCDGAGEQQGSALRIVAGAGEDSAGDAVDTEDKVGQRQTVRLGVDTVRVFKRTLKLMAIHELYRAVLSRPLVIVVGTGAESARGGMRQMGETGHTMVLTQRSRYLQRFLESINSVVG